MTDSPRKRLDLAALSGWAPELAQTFASLTSDIALVVDGEGVITSVAVPASRPFSASSDWVGQPWIDTVTGDTRGKIASLLQEVNAEGLARRREVNHPAAAGATIPVAYTAIRLGDDGPVLAVGRDLRMVAALQQRYLDSQSDLERRYWQIRQSDVRLEQLARVERDALLAVDADTLQVLEVNGRASRLLDLRPDQLTGRPVAAGFDAFSRLGVEELLQSAARSGRDGEIGARLAGRMASVAVSVRPLRGEGRLRLLVRVRTIDQARSTDIQAARGGAAPVVLTDRGGRITAANPAFAALVGLADASAATKAPLGEWLDTAPMPFDRCLRSVREQGVLRDRGGSIRPRQGPLRDVQWTATLLDDADAESIGFIIEPLASPPSAAAPSAPPVSGALLADALSAITGRLGQDQLPDLLEACRRITRRHLVTLALHWTDGDRDAAARLLGIPATELDDDAGGIGPAAEQSS